MTKRIIYNNDEGGVSIIIPSPNALLQYTIAQIAAKDVPPGKEYWIVTTESVSDDRTFRNAWEIDKDNIGSSHGVGNTSNKWD